MINWQELSKEKKQLVVMSGVLAVIAVFLVFQFGLSPFLAKRAAMTKEYSELEAQLGQATEAVKTEAQLRESLADKTRMLDQAMREYIPAQENLLSWATKAIYSEARSVGVDIESVSELDASVGWTSKDQDKRVFKPYSVRIATQCTYAQLVRLVRALEKKNPLMFVSSINIQGRDADKHVVLISVEWPSWKSADRIPDLSGKEIAPALPPPAAPAAK